MSAFFVGILRRSRPGHIFDPSYTAVSLQGNPEVIAEDVYRMLLMEKDQRTWFQGNGAYARARMFAHLLCDEAIAYGQLGVEVVDLYSLVPDRTPAKPAWPERI